MRFLTEGKYEFENGVLRVLAEHERRQFFVMIDRKVFERRYRATATGDFHEYWQLLLQNRSELESIARDKLASDHAPDGDAITITNRDLEYAKNP